MTVLVDAYELLERQRPIVDAAPAKDALLEEWKPIVAAAVAIVDATSGEARGQAVRDVVDAVNRARGG